MFLQSGDGISRNVIVSERLLDTERHGGGILGTGFRGYSLCFGIFGTDMKKSGNCLPSQRIEWGRSVFLDSLDDESEQLVYYSVFEC